MDDNRNNNEKIKSVKSKIERLIENGHLKEAMAALDMYEGKMPGDPDICSMRAVIYILEGKTDLAEKAIFKGLEKDTVHFDLLFNLAYIRELQGQCQEAADLYCKASTVAVDDYHKQSVSEAIERLKRSDSGIKISAKPRIVFFVKYGMNNFFEDIIAKLEGEFWTRKILVNDLSQLEEGMEWTDICWFEWCDELVATASYLPVCRAKKVICRLHRYEAFTQYPAKVSWESVDKLVVVAPHIKELLEKNFPGISRKVDIVVIENGVDLDRFSFRKRDKGFNIAMVGYLHSRKNPVMVLQIMNKLVKRDPRYKLYVAGKFQEQLMKLYWEYQVRRMGLENNIFFDGWQEDISTWLEDKNYLLSATIHESFGYGIAEAMSRGIKPVIHDFLHAEEIWDRTFLFNTVDEAVEMILDDNYNSETYRDYIRRRFSLDDKVNEIRNLLSGLLEEASNGSAAGNDADAPVFTGKAPREKELITMVYRTYSGSNTVALCKLIPEEVAEEFDVKLIIQSSDQEFYDTLARSRMIVTTHGGFKCSSDQICVDLWHGVPLKTVGAMVHGQTDEQIKGGLYWWTKVDAATSYSQLYSSLMNACMNIGGNKYFITGAPRNDLLLTSDGRKNLSDLMHIDLDGKKVLFFLPTFRTTHYGRYDGDKEWDNIFGMRSFDIVEFDKFLEDNNIVFITKLHPNEEYKMIDLVEQKITRNMVLLRNSDLIENRTDLYEILNAADLLITDYSSVFFDFLLLDRPIVFTPVDLDSYRKLRGMLLGPYDFWTPGPKALDQETLEKEILYGLSNADSYAAQRKTIKDIMHYYQDANSSKRVWNMLISMLHGKEPELPQ